VGNFQLCKSMDKVAARYQAEAKKAGKAASSRRPPRQPAPTPARSCRPAAPAAAGRLRPRLHPQPLLPRSDPRRAGHVVAL
jgi:hypothetical protein